MDSSLFGAWLRLARSTKFYLIPLSLFAWGLSLLLLSYTAGNFWLERERSSALFGLLIAKGQIVQGRILDGVAEDNTSLNGRVDVDHNDENNVNVVDGRTPRSEIDPTTVPAAAKEQPPVTALKVTAQTAAPSGAIKSATSAPFHVGYILHFNWSVWNALVMPTLALLIVWLYRSTDTISRSLVANRVVSVESGINARAREKLQLYLEQVSFPLEAWFTFGAITLVTIHAWNDGRDSLTNLGFAQAQKYLPAYIDAHISPSLMTIFLFIAYAGTYVTLAILAHFLIWAIVMYRRLGKLFPNVGRNGDVVGPEAVAVETNNEETEFLVELRYDDPEGHFGIASLSHLFDGIHWIASVCIIESPIQRVGELLRDPHTRIEAQAWETPIISIACATVLLLMPLLLTSERVRKYKRALQDNGKDVRKQKVWPAGSIPVRFLAFSVVISITLPILEAIYPNQPYVALGEYWKVGLIEFCLWFSISLPTFISAYISTYMRPASPKI